MSPEEFESRLAAHLPSLRRAARRLTRDAGLAEDAVQDAMLKAWTRAGAMRDEARFEPWLKAILRSVLVDEVRRRARTLPAQLPSEAELGALPGGQLAALELQQVLGYVAMLTPVQREAIVLVEIFGHSHAEAARILGCTVPAIAQRLARARAALAPLKRSA
ncbi:MAG: RNA polymerase sigma factor [Pseudomonadota bacterium]